MSSDLLKLNGVTLITNKFVKIWANENAVSEFMQNIHALLLWFVLKSTYNTVAFIFLLLPILQIARMSYSSVHPGRGCQVYWATKHFTSLKI